MTTEYEFEHENEEGSWTCDVCKSKHVQHLVVGWMDLNDDLAEVQEPSVAEVYPDTTWCKGCRAHTNLTYTPNP